MSLCNIYYFYYYSSIIVLLLLLLLYYYYLCLYVLTNTQEVPTHSAAPSKCIHSSNPKSHKDETGTDRQDITGIQTAQADTLQQPMLICGHTHASPEPRPDGLRKHTQTCTVHEKGPSTQPNARSRQFSKLCDLDYWNGRFLNVAHELHAGTFVASCSSGNIG
jgi:hypothetical protein